MPSCRLSSRPIGAIIASRSSGPTTPWSSPPHTTTAGYREWEGLPRMDIEKGRPYGHRERIPGFEATELKAYRRNVEWVRGHDLYAGTLVSMHRTGLWRGRYDVPDQSPNRESGASAAVSKLSSASSMTSNDRTGAPWPPETPDSKPSCGSTTACFSLFDLLSLYFCCDGYGDDGFKDERLAPIPAGYAPDDPVELRLAPNPDGSVQMEPYPFDIAPLRVSVRTQRTQPGQYESEADCRAAYYKTPSTLLHFDITD